MPILSFSLNLDGVIRIHNAVQCLAKFSDTVSLEARSDRVSRSLMRRTTAVLIYHLFSSLPCPRSTLQNPHMHPSLWTVVLTLKPIAIMTLDSQTKVKKGRAALPASSTIK